MELNSELNLYRHVEFLKPPSKIQSESNHGKLSKSARKKLNRARRKQATNQPGYTPESRHDSKLSGNELFFFPNNYDATPVRSTFLNDSVRKKNYLEKIKGKSVEEQRKFRTQRDARYLHKKANNSNGATELSEHDVDEFCFDHLVGRCNKNCGRWHQMRIPRFFGVCKYYISNVCVHGESCGFMHGEFPCRFFYLDLEHPEWMNKDNCRFKHGGYFKKQIEHWVKDLTKTNPEQFENLLKDYLSKLDAVQSKLGRKNDVKQFSSPSKSSVDKFGTKNMLSTNQIQTLARRNVTSVEQINQIPLDDLLGLGLNIDQIYHMTTNADACETVATGSIKSIVTENEKADENVLIENLSPNSNDSISCENVFQGFSIFDSNETEDILKYKRSIIYQRDESDQDDMASDMEVNDEECFLPILSDDSDEFSLVINENN